MGKVAVEVVFVLNLDLWRLTLQVLIFSHSLLIVCFSGFRDCHWIRSSQICKVTEFFADKRWILHWLNLREFLFSLLLFLLTKFLLKHHSLLGTWRVRSGDKGVTWGMWVHWHWDSLHIIPAICALSFFFNRAKWIRWIHERVCHRCWPLTTILALASRLESFDVGLILNDLGLGLNFKLSRALCLSFILHLLLSDLSLHS